MADQITVTLTAEQVKDICRALEWIVSDLDQEPVLTSKWQKAEARYRNISGHLASMIKAGNIDDTAFVIHNYGPRPGLFHVKRGAE